MTTATKKRKSSGSRKATAEGITVECAFCSGIGRDPYEIMSKLSNCPVCNGRMEVRITKPAYPCAYCHGTGKQRHTRLTCTVCKGVGQVTVAGPTAKCSECNGSGKVQGADLPCTLCRGTGLIAKEANAAKQNNRSASKGRAASKTQ